VRSQRFGYPNHLAAYRARRRDFGLSAASMTISTIFAMT
jgi:hypothetical protein